MKQLSGNSGLSSRAEWRWPAHAPLALVAAMTLLLCASPALGQLEPPLHEQPPWDEIKLNEAGGGAVLRVFPLVLPDRKLPEQPDPATDLTLRLLEKPDRTYTVKWRYVGRVRLFERMVLEEAESHLAAGRFGDAWTQLCFLEKHYPQLPKLADAMERYLQAIAVADFKRGKYEESLVLMFELQRRNPARKGLDTAIQRVAEKLLEALATDENPSALAHLVAQLEVRAPTATSAILPSWQAKLEGRANEYLSRAKEAMQAGDWSRASRECQRALAAWPEVPEGARLAAEIHQRYPRVLVGVVEAWRQAASDGHAENTSAATQRIEGLFWQPLYTLRAGAERLQFDSRWVSRVAAGEDSLRTRLEIAPSARWLPERGGLSASSLAAAIQRSAVVRHTENQTLASVLQSVSVIDPYTLELKWHRPAPFSSVLASVRLNDTPRYRPVNSSPVETTFRRHELASQLSGGKPAGEQPPAEIVERHFATVTAAIEALRIGEIDVVERATKAEVAALGTDAKFIAKPYAVPVEYWLELNPRGTAFQSPLRRQAFLALLGDTARLGVTAPQPAAAASSGNRTLAAQLDDATARQVWHALEAEEKKPLVLLHPPDAKAAGACRKIQQALARHDMVIELHPLRVGEPQNPASDVAWDLRFDELREASLAGSRQESDGAIRLGREQEFAVWRQGITGLGDLPVALYDNIDDWRVEPRKPTP